MFDDADVSFFERRGKMCNYDGSEPEIKRKKRKVKRKVRIKYKGYTLKDFIKKWES